MKTLTKDQQIIKEQKDKINRRNKLIRSLRCELKFARSPSCTIRCKTGSKCSANLSGSLSARLKPRATKLDSTDASEERR